MMRFMCSSVLLLTDVGIQKPYYYNAIDLETKVFRLQTLRVLTFVPKVLAHSRNNNNIYYGITNCIVTDTSCQRG